MIESAEGREELANLNGIGRIEHKGLGFAAERFSGRVEALLAPAGDGHLQTIRQQSLRRREADAGRSADDDGVFAAVAIREDH